MQCIVSEKSKIELPNYPGSFSLFSEGKQLLSSTDMLEEMTDHFRNMIEKTDNMQGLRVLADVDCGFGSFGAKYLQEIKDEFSKKPIMLYCITGPDVNSEPYSDERSSVIKELKGYNLPLAVVGFNELVHSIVPIDLNYYGQIKRFPDHITGFKHDSLFHSSSIP